MPNEPPLTTLLSWVWVAWTIELDKAFEAVTEARVGRAFRISLAMWANGLRLIDEDGITVKALQAPGAACNLAGLERWRWIAIGEQTDERREGYGSSRGSGATRCCVRRAWEVTGAARGRRSSKASRYAAATDSGRRSTS